MKSLKNDLTLGNIKKLFDEAFDRKFDEKFDKAFDRKSVSILGELSGLKQQITEGDDSLNRNIEALRKETKEGFDGVYDALDDITHTLDRDFEPRIKNLERKQQFPPLQSV